MEITKFTDRDKQRYGELKTQIKQGWLMFAQGILEVRNSKLYRLEYDTFDAFVDAELGISRARSYQLVDAAETMQNLEMYTKVDILPQRETYVRPLTKLEPPLQREAWRETVERHGDNITAAKVKEVADEYDTANAFMKEAQQPPTFDRPPMTV